MHSTATRCAFTFTKAANSSQSFKKGKSKSTIILWVKKGDEVKEKEGGFCFTVNKAATSQSLLHCWSAGSISDWVQDQKQERFLRLLRQTKALTSPSPLLSFSSSLSLSSLSTLSHCHSFLLNTPGASHALHLVLFLFYSSLYVFLSSKKRKYNRQPCVSWRCSVLAQRRWKCVLYLEHSIKTTFSVSGSKMDFTLKAFIFFEHRFKIGN